MFRTSGVCSTTPATFIWETLHQLFEKLELLAVYRKRFFSHRQRPEDSVNSFLGYLRKFTLKAFDRLSPVECKENICERFYVGFRNCCLCNKLTLRPAENLSIALIMARVCKAPEQLNEKKAAEKRALHFGQNPLTLIGSPDGESLTVTSPAIAVSMKPLSVSSSSSKETVLFLVDTCSLIRAQLADRLTEHRKAPVKPVRLLAASSAEVRVTSLSSRVPIGSFSLEHQFIACPNLHREAILRVDYLGCSKGLLDLRDNQMTTRSSVVGLEEGRLAEVCSALDSRTKTSSEIEKLNTLRLDKTLPATSTQLVYTLSTFRDVFALGDDAPRRTSVVQHETDTSNHRPIKQALRRLRAHYK
ncbi:hypothetical protein EG68_10884 [Paragonimus skrjabini miyazakii]|uniref:Uncharacterized protein n=1 Tax=Paragonimus skrjabini miyazakii TaxID=59628 RepID=A0A8S9YKG2_9TREM|nr:hypothetical protein EG68_10884 [Paragonimus skrjabini miyazakii]